MNPMKEWFAKHTNPGRLRGTISEANEELEWESDVVNKDPYGKGWLARIKASNLAELNELLRPSSPEFAAHIAAERAKYKK